MSGSPGRALARVPAPALFIGSGIVQHLGAALAVTLFAVIPATGVAWLRILVAALVLLAWRRPWRLSWTRRDLGLVVLFGLALAGMNVAFYVAIDNLPLGTAVAIEFIGPVAVAAATGSGWRERVGVGLAAVGVVLLAGVTLNLGGAEAAVGVLAILIAAAAWGGYILLGRRVALRGDGIARLSAAMAVAAVVLAPLLAGRSVGVLGSWYLVGAVVAVALMSSVLPYAIEQLVLRRVGPAAFAVLLSLLPAAATLVGALVLRQLPHLADLVGLVLVSAAIGLTAPGRRAAAPTESGPAGA